MVDATTAPIKQAQTTYDTQAQNQQQNVTGLTSALASILQGIAPGVEKTYADASTRQSAFAKGFSDQMQQHLGENASNTSSFLQNIVGAPTSQIAQTSALVAPAAAGDTLYGLQGYIPAGTLNQEGAAYTAAAKQLPATANTQGLQQIAKIQAAQAAQDATFARDIGTEAGKAPQYQRQLQQDATSNAFRQHSADLADAKFTLQQKVDAFNQQYKVDSLNLKGQSLQLSANKFARSIIQSDRTYAVALAGLGLKTAASKRAALAAEYKLKTGGFTPTQIAKYNGLLQTGIDTLPKDATYEQYIAKSVEHGVPLSLAVEKANAHWPANQRPDAGVLASILGNPLTDSGTLTPSLVDAPAMLESNAITNITKQFLGVPYKWGGTNAKTGLDCSAFIQATFRQLGVSLPRTTYAQVKKGQAVDLNQLQPGDAIFTEPGKNGPNHVGLYIGGGQVQESPHTGDVNKIIPLKSFLSGGFVAARRYLGNG